MFRRSASALTLTVAFLCLGSTGCVTGEVRTFLKYEAKSDQFQCMQVYTNLHATDAKDLEHLAGLWNRREAIILNPIDLTIFTTLAYERVDKHSYRVVSLGEPTTPEVLKTPVDLNQIKVTPGTFYLNTHGNLSYFHQSTVPGSTIDALLTAAAQTLAQDLSGFAQKQQQLAKGNHFHRVSWEELRKELLASLDSDSPKNNSPSGEPLYPLQEQTWELWMAAASNSSVTLSRKHDQFTVTIPLSERDAQEVLQILKDYREAVRNRVETKQSVPPGVTRFLESLDARRVEKSGITFTGNATAFLNLGERELHPNPDPSKRVGYESTVKDMRKRGIALGDSAAVERAVTAYPR